MFRIKPGGNMTENSIRVRFAKLTDAQDLLAIYEPYVLHTAITFEYIVPDVDDFTNRIRTIQRKFPYIVAESEDGILGYAYASSFHSRAAYDWCVETSIYVDQTKKKQGIGKILYNTLENILKEMNIYNVNACIGCPEQDDEYLTRNSISFHEHLGYSLVGEFHKCGYKFDRWYNMVWMEKFIGEHSSYPPKVVGVNELRNLLKEKHHIY